MEMTDGELAVLKAEENRTREIIDILRDCKTVEEALEKVRALLRH